MRVLILSPYFAPENSVASIRFTKIAKYLIRLGYDVDVIRTDMSAKITVDPMLESDAEQIKNIYTVNYPSLFYDIQNINSAPEDNGKKSLFSRFYKCASKTKLYDSLAQYAAYKKYEVPLAHEFVRKIQELVQRNGVYDCIITTFSPFSTIIAGEQAKKLGYCKRWILDYRDHVVSFKKRSHVTRKMSNVAKKMNVYADYITTVSEGLKERIADGNSDIEKKIHVITNGADMEECKFFGREEKTKELCFVFAGSVYTVGDDVNSPEPLFSALSKMIEEGSVDPGKIKIRYVGTYGSVFDELAKKYNMRECLEDFGRVTREQVYNIYATSDIFLICVWNNTYSKGILTGKFFESLVAKLPVLAIVVGNEKNSELAQIINKKSLGFAYEQAENNANELKQWIQMCYNSKLNSGLVEYNPQDVYEYTHEALAKRFAELIGK